MQFVVEPKQLKDIALLKYAGGDCMVVATSFFSAGRLHTISEEEIRIYKDECVRVEVKLFVEVTRLFVDGEMKRLEAFIAYLKELDVDGIYFADLCVFEVARDLDMCEKCIYQPDTLITNHVDAALYLSFGLKAVGVARELTLEEICEIAQVNENKVEVLIHGIPLMSASKRQLVSHYFEQIAYQGEKKPYYVLKEEHREASMPVVENEQGTYFFGGYCLYSYQEIAALKQSGVGYVRILSDFLDTIQTVIALQLYYSVLRKKTTIAQAMSKVEESDLGHVYSSGFYYLKTSSKKESQE